MVRGRSKAVYRGGQKEITAESLNHSEHKPTIKYLLCQLVYNVCSWTINKTRQGVMVVAWRGNQSELMTLNIFGDIKHNACKTKKEWTGGGKQNVAGGASEGESTSLPVQKKDKY